MKPLLVFGLDGCSLPILREVVRRRPGGLFERLLEGGQARDLLSTRPYFTAPAWTTFMTGLDPDTHGVFHWRRRFRHQDGGRRLVSSAHLAQASFWWWAQRAGARVSITNFPMEYPAPPVVGRHVCGTLAPEEATDSTWPRALLGKLRQALPGYRFEMDQGLSLMDRPRELQRSIERLGREHLEALERFGAADTADLVVHVNTATDRIQHFFWHCWDPDYPGHAEGRAALGDPVADVYADAEAGLERLWETGRWDNLLLVSDHGAGPARLVFHLDAWLLEQGCASAGPDGRLDPATSDAYGGEEPECALYVNRRDRDGCGVEPERYRDLLDRLAAELAAVERPDGAGPAFDAVHRAPDLYDGPRADLAPDLVLEPAEGVHPRPGPSTTVFSDATRLYANHRRPGLLLGFGDAFRAPGADDPSPEPLAMRDVFPLMCALADLPRPTGLAGRVPAELLTPEAASVPVDGDLEWPRQVAGDPPLQEESPQMLDRLRELGYIDG